MPSLKVLLIESVMGGFKALTTEGQEQGYRVFLIRSRSMSKKFAGLKKIVGRALRLPSLGNRSGRPTIRACNARLT